MKIKKSELARIEMAIDETLSKSTKVKLNMLLDDNKSLIDANLKSLKNALKPTDGYKEFEKNRTDVCHKFCVKDKNGEPVIKDGEYVGLANNKEFDVEIEKLKVTHKEDIDNYANQIKEYNDLMSEEVDFKFVHVDIDLIPDDLISGTIQSILRPLFKKEVE